MRTYSLLVSVLAHVGLLAAAFVASAVATDVLPDPRRTTEFIVVAPPPPPVPPPAPAVRPLVPPTPSPAAPVDAPQGVQPELNDPIGAAPLNGSIVPGGDVGGVVPDGGAPPPPPPVVPLRVGGVIQAPRKTLHVAPVYPSLARASRKSGVVILEAVIAEDGSVRDVRVLRSEPLLDAAAVDAVRQWRFTPTLLNGQPVPVIMTVTVGFTLN